MISRRRVLTGLIALTSTAVLPMGADPSPAITRKLTCTTVLLPVPGVPRDAPAGQRRPLPASMCPAGTLTMPHDRPAVGRVYG